MLDRRKLLAGAAALVGHAACARAAVSYEWQTTTTAEAGFAPGFGARLDQFILRRAVDLLWRRNRADREDRGE